MKPLSHTKAWVSLVTLCGLALAMVLVTSLAKADEWDKKTTLTIDQPIQVTDTVLQPGKYVFKLSNSNSDRHIVQIFNEDQNHLINTILAIPNYRLQPTGNSRFTFWETPPGTVKAMRAWFYPGDNFGQEFRYPKQLALLNTTTAQAAPPPPPAPAPAPLIQRETPPPATAPQAEVQKREEPAVVAQNTPPPPPAAEPAPAPAPAPQELPKTASPFTLAGLGGLLSLGVFSLLRVSRLS
jgi:outer membrane biosynthesis protein TonB